MATRQREKAAKIAETRDKRPTAIAKYIRIPSGKVEVVLDLIRGKSYEQAVAILNHTNKSASPVILKVLNSAAANAENNLNIIKDNLYVAQCWAMPGPIMKRMMTRARGSADRIQKKTCHIRIILDEKLTKKPLEVKKAVKATSAKPVTTTDKERPLAKAPNAKKPLGEKKAPVTKTPVKPASAKPATAKAPVKPVAKPAVKKEAK